MKQDNDRAFPGSAEDLETFWLNGHEYRVFAGGDGTDDDPNDTGGGDDDPNDPSDEDDDSDKPSDEDDKPQFTQKQVNDLIGKAKNKATRGKLNPKELGFDSRKEMEDFIEAAKKDKDAAKSEADKAIEKAKEDAAKAARDEVLPKAKKIALKAEFKVQAKDAGITIPLEDAFALVQNAEGFDEVEVDDEGVVTGFDEDFFEELKKAKPFMFAGEEGDDDEGSDDAGAGAGGRRRGKKNNVPREEELKKTYPALSRR